ncbi:Solute carrier family 35 member E3 [Tolypocladium capitatum]|uniref:GDP-mannose transporter n=1 Tax=Tolypocladium capitatum TaxID=45235 RepID=A0A2K3QAV6_9HYPO|nr:Solute carrier family 35 member E3 [Tolypocladium capitatum]
MGTPCEPASPEPIRDPVCEEEQLDSRVCQDGGSAKTGLLVPSEQPDTNPPSFVAAVGWMAVNTLATVGIVFTNKAIFSDPSWKLCQLTFASFHFSVTWATLFVLSRPHFTCFTPRRASIQHLLPLAIAMCLNVILPNLSLVFSSVTFYQVARILLTPVVALMNFVLHGAILPPIAIAALVPACLGVGMVSYYDSIPTDSTIQTTSSLGIAFAFTGIFASSLYTVWIASFRSKLQMSSMQLLYNQAPIASFLLLYAIPFLDTFPDWVHVSTNMWFMIALSGVFASLINISQFFIVAQTGPVSSTVVGHLKTCTIVAMGWMVSGRAIGDRAMIGVLVAVAGIIA